MLPVPAPMRTPPSGNTEAFGMKVAAAISGVVLALVGLPAEFSASVLRSGW